MAVPIAVVYIISSIGSVFGGWLPMNFIKMGWPIFKARKTSMLIYALCAIPVFTAQLLGVYSVWFPVLIVGFGAAAHQAWSANIYTTVSDMFPKNAVASVTGVAGMAGGFGGIIVSKSAGYLFDYYKSLHNIEKGYFILFTFCSIAYVTAWLIIHILVPKMKKIEM